MRSLSYDVRQSKRFRRLGVLAVVTVAGGVLTTGVLLRTPVPELMGFESEQGGSGITDGWFGFGSDTREQDAETEPGSMPDTDTDNGSAREAPEAAATPDEQPSQGAATSPSKPGNPPKSPGLHPIDRSDSPSPEEENETSQPAEPTPSEDPTSDEPSPSEEPTSEAPEPTREPSDLPEPTMSPSAD